MSSPGNRAIDAMLDEIARQQLDPKTVFRVDGVELDEIRRQTRESLAAIGQAALGLYAAGMDNREAQDCLRKAIQRSGLG